MKLQTIAILALCMAGTSVMAGEHPILPLVLNDGVYFDAGDFSGRMSMSVKGPENFYWKGSGERGESMFLDAANLNGAALADGLYVYEMDFIPAVLVNRSNMSVAEQDAHARSFKNIPSPISGSFRVVNGAIVEPFEEE